MPQTLYQWAEAVSYEVWDGTPESLTAIEEFARRPVTINSDGSLAVLLDSGEVSLVQRGWSVDRGASGRLGVMSAGKRAELHDAPEPASP